MSIQIEQVTKQFGHFTALAGVNLGIQPGEFLALLGPSGSGKTTLLRILGGLDFPDTGRVTVDGQDISHVPARERRVGFVFQSYALFRHMSVLENVAFGLRVRSRATRPPGAEIIRRARELLGIVQIDNLGARYPDQLSGGQRQRVALARALAIDPTLLLLDEPFGALDAKVRKDLREWLRALQKRLGITSVFVTHDQTEALAVADRVAVLCNGHLEQVATPTELYDRPATRFVHEFPGDAAVIPCLVQAGTATFGGLAIPPVHTDAPDAPADAYLREHEIEVKPGKGGGGAGTVRAIRSVGPVAYLTLEIGGHALEATLPVGHPDLAGLAPGTGVDVRPLRARVFSTPRQDLSRPVDAIAAE